MQWDFFSVFVWVSTRFSVCIMLHWYLLNFVFKLPIGFSAKLHLHAFLFSLTSLHKTTLYLLLWYYRTNIVDNNYLSTVSKKKKKSYALLEGVPLKILLVFGTVYMYYCKIVEEQMIKSYFKSYFLSINEQWTYCPT